MKTLGVSFGVSAPQHRTVEILRHLVASEKKKIVPKLKTLQQATEPESKEKTKLLLFTSTAVDPLLRGASRGEQTMETHHTCRLQKNNGSKDS